MLTGSYNYLDLLLILALASALSSFAVAIPSPGSVYRRNNNPLNIDWDPAPSPEDGPELSRGAIRDPAYLPVQIGGIVGSYAVSLVLVAIGLLALAKTRRDHIRAGEALEAGELELPAFQLDLPAGFKTEEEYFQALAEAQEADPQGQYPPQTPRTLLKGVPYPLQTPKSPYKNFTYPGNAYPASPTRSEYQNSHFTIPSPASTVIALGYDLSIDQSVVQKDKEMAQSQLEDMYKYVMEQEEAKQQGRVYEGPQLSKPGTPASILKKEKNRPTGLNLDRDEKSQSRGSSILSSILKSPRGKKGNKAVSISSPIMTPMSGTFPRYGEGEQEMNAIPPRQYAPVPPPPVPTDKHPFYQQRRATGNTLPLTPEMSPTSVTSIDGRLDAALAAPPMPRASRDTKESSHTRDNSAMTDGSGAEPVSAISERSTSPLVGLPSSPKPGVNRFPSLPASPRPGQQSFFPGASSSRENLPASPKPSVTSFSQAGFRANAPSAVRTGGALPLRAYEPSMVSPRMGQQTVFTRPAPGGPMSPGMLTGAAVPYSPYQPFSPVIPMTPSLVTKADRKRMRRMEPKTPTVELVRSMDDTW